MATSLEELNMEQDRLYNQSYRPLYNYRLGISRLSLHTNLLVNHTKDWKNMTIQHIITINHLSFLNQ